MQVEAAVNRALAESGQAFETVADLCELAARRDPRLRAWSEGEPVKIAACYPRAVRGLFAAAGAPLDAGHAEFLNLRVQSAEEVIAALLTPALDGARVEEGKRNTAQQSPSRRGWKIEDGEPRGKIEPTPNAATPPRSHAWFPVIDFDRCTNCLQCLGFCLFGVYGVDERRRITVQVPENCKTNCPACSRVCPESAIMFPKHNAGPINGEAVGPAGTRRETMKVDISALLGGDVYQRLRERNGRGQARFSKERDSDLALAERRRCLAKLAELGDIPPEVLMGLPAPEEIRRRAEAAKAKVKELRPAS